jgi:hypothetical protein
LSYLLLSSKSVFLGLSVSEGLLVGSSSVLSGKLELSDTGLQVLDLGSELVKLSLVDLNGGGILLVLLGLESLLVGLSSICLGLLLSFGVLLGLLSFSSELVMEVLSGLGDVSFVT